MVPFFGQRKKLTPVFLKKLYGINFATLCKEYGLVVGWLEEISSNKAYKVRLVVYFSTFDRGGKVNELEWAPIKIVSHWHFWL